jgi:hypothetical protein
MNTIHGAIIEFLRETKDAKLERLLALTDVQIVHRMFFNHRGQRGVRLTHFGLQIMEGYFQSYDVAVPKDETIKPGHLVFLDERATLPYYCGEGRIVVFDGDLGVKLRLVDGRLSALVSIEVG